MPDTAARRRALRRLVSGGVVHSQAELVAALQEQGFDVTQATVSRDLAAMGVSKNGLRYVLGGRKVDHGHLARTISTYVETIAVSGQSRCPANPSGCRPGGGGGPRCRRGGRGDRDRGGRRHRPRHCRRSPTVGRNCNASWKRWESPDESCAGLLGRPRHLGDSGLAHRGEGRRGGHLHGRCRSGRGGRRSPDQGTGDRRGRSRGGRPARGVRARRRFPGDPGQCRLRGVLPPRNLSRPSHHHPRNDEDRQGSWRRCHLPRRHRQGQRPGPLRVVCLRSRPRHQGHRSLAGVEAQGQGRPRRVRPGKGHPGSGHDREAVFDRRQSSSHLLRGRCARGSLGIAAGRDVQAHRRSGSGAR